MSGLFNKAMAIYSFRLFPPLNIPTSLFLIFSSPMFFRTLSYFIFENSISVSSTVNELFNTLLYGQYPFSACFGTSIQPDVCFSDWVRHLKMVDLPLPLRPMRP